GVLCRDNQCHSDAEISVDSSFLIPPRPITCIYTLSLHDALPILSSPPLTIDTITISGAQATDFSLSGSCAPGAVVNRSVGPCALDRKKHTSELQSRENLVCRLLLEKKKKYRRISACM